MRDTLKMSVDTSSSDEHTLRTCPGVLSGPGVFFGFVLLRTKPTCPNDSESGEFSVTSVLMVVNPASVCTVSGLIDLRWSYLVF